MASRTRHPLIQYVRKAATQGDPPSDGQLLERFVQRRDEAAFAALVQRHGAMVFGVCRRVLAHMQDAEDAFQATFLVLARKAGSVNPRDRVGPWLYGVAYRTALDARTARNRRRFKEAQAPVRSQPEETDPWHELRGELDRELHHLPEKYRLPVLLCDLEGKTQQEAARQLGWPEGTVSGRLFRARQLLARRLTKQGVAITALALPALLSQHAAAAVPPELVSATITAGVKLAAPAPLAAVVSEPVTRLTQGVLRTMFLRRIRFVAILCLGVAVLATAAYPLALQLLAAEQPDPPAQASAAQNPTPKADQPPPQPPNAKQTFEQMEKKILQAKTVKCSVDSTMTLKDKKVGFKLKLALGGGNKVRMEMEVDTPGEAVKKELIICDGKQEFAGGKKTEKGVPKNMEKNFLVSLSRCGLTAPLSFIYVAADANGNVDPDHPDIEKLCKVSGWKLGKSEVVGGKQATVLHHQFTLGDDKMVFKTTVWIEPKTSLPLKRLVTMMGNGENIELTETYADWAIDQPIPAEQFKIPQE